MTSFTMPSSSTESNRGLFNAQRGAHDASSAKDEHEGLGHATRLSTAAAPALVHLASSVALQRRMQGGQLRDQRLRSPRSVGDASWFHVADKLSSRDASGGTSIFKEALPPIIPHVPAGGPAGSGSAVPAPASVTGTQLGQPEASGRSAQPLVSPRSSDFTILRRQVLGVGTFGTVYKAFDNLNGRQAAVKEGMLSRDATRRHGNLQAEFALLKRLSHPNVVSVYDFRILDGGSTAQIFLEWLPGGSVRSMMRQMGFRLHENVVRRFIKDALRGLAYLHEENVVQGDFKAANLLLSSDGTVKVSDMGSARIAAVDEGERDQLVPAIVGTAAFLSPEVVNGMRITFKSDTWAVGATIVELTTGALPWSGVASREQMSNSISLIYFIGSRKPPDHHPGIPQHLSRDMQRILRWCFQFNPADRPTAAKLLADPYFADVGVPWPEAEPMEEYSRKLESAQAQRRYSLNSEDASLCGGGQRH